MRLPKYFLKSKLFIAIKFLIRHIYKDIQSTGIVQMDWMILDIYEVEIEIISEFWVIGKLQYAGIYGKLKRRNKLWTNGKLSYNNLDDKVDYSYLCGDNNMLNYLCLSCLNHELNHKERADRH